MRKLVGYLGLRHYILNKLPKFHQFNSNAWEAGAMGLSAMSPNIFGNGFELINNFSKILTKVWAKKFFLRRLGNNFLTIFRRKIETWLLFSRLDYFYHLCWFLIFIFDNQQSSMRIFVIFNDFLSLRLQGCGVRVYIVNLVESQVYYNTRVVCGHKIFQINSRQSIRIIEYHRMSEIR